MIDWSSDVCSSDLSLISLAVQTRFGSGLLRPFKAAGRVAFSLYFLQQLLGMWVLFAPWGFNLWGRFGWASMSAIAFAVIAGEIVLANLWLRHFVSGPLEWAWRSLAYQRSEEQTSELQSLMRISYAAF